VLKSLQVDSPSVVLLQLNSEKGGKSVDVNGLDPIKVIKLQDQYEKPKDLMLDSDDVYTEKIQKINERFEENSKLQKARTEQMKLKFEDYSLSSLKMPSVAVLKSPSSFIEKSLSVSDPPASSSPEASNLTLQCNIDCSNPLVKNCNQAKIDCLQMGIEDIDARLLADRCAQLLALNVCKPECGCTSPEDRTDLTKTGGSNGGYNP
jgi:hypothetical protein